MVLRHDRRCGTKFYTGHRARLPAHHRAAAAIVDTVADEERWLHMVTFVECPIGPARAGRLEPAAAALRAAFETVDVDLEAPLRWARLRADTGLRLPDSIVLDTALVTEQPGSSAIVTGAASIPGRTLPVAQADFPREILSRSVIASCNPSLTATTPQRSGTG